MTAEDRCCEMTAAPPHKDAVIPELGPGFVELTEFLITPRSSAANEAEVLQSHRSRRRIHPSTCLLVSSRGRSLQLDDNDIHLSMCCFMMRAQQLHALMMADCGGNGAFRSSSQSHTHPSTIFVRTSRDLIYYPVP